MGDTEIRKINAVNKTTGYSPLAQAIMDGNLEQVDYLVKEGANTEDVMGMSAINYALLFNKSNIIQYFKNRKEYEDRLLYLDKNPNKINIGEFQKKPENQKLKGGQRKSRKLRKRSKRKQSRRR